MEFNSADMRENGMNLIARLEADAGTEESFFRAALLREDVSRLRKLQELSVSVSDLKTFKSEGTKLGWTQGDARTWELKDALDPLFDAFYQWTRDPSLSNGIRVERSWDVFYSFRLKTMIGCLSRVPKPDGDQ